MIERHDEHSFDLELIAPGEWALDIGCRGFVIPRLLASRGVNVMAVDPDPSLPDGGGASVVFRRAAVLPFEVATNRKFTKLHLHPSDMQAHTTVRHQGGRTVTVLSTSMQALRDELDIPQFALIKIDCEGAEYALMRDVSYHARHTPIARQISVEYHDHCGLNPQADMEAWYACLHRRLAPYYDIARHVREVPPWGGPPHYVDTLYVLRREFWRTRW